MAIATRRRHHINPLQLQLTLGKTRIEQVHELSQLRNYVNAETRKLFYIAHILYHINYASTVWDGCIEVNQ